VTQVREQTNFTPKHFADARQMSSTLVLP